MGPGTSGVGWVFICIRTLNSTGQLGLGELRTLQDWTIRTALSGVSGVAEVAAFGGQVERYRNRGVDPAQLKQHKISLSELKIWLFRKPTNRRVEVSSNRPSTSM